VFQVDDSKVSKLIKKIKAGTSKTRDIEDIMALLTSELSLGTKSLKKESWSNLSELSSISNRKLTSNQVAYHCHLIKGKPTYVAVWIEEESKDGRFKTVEIVYVGTHEKALY